MSLINIIVLFLLLTPLYAVFTDIKTGKIKNYFIFPVLAISIILTFFISWFYTEKNNIIWMLIVIIFGYLFYKNNKWWAGDWKYIILIWLNSIIISYLLWLNIVIINSLFISIFTIFFLYNLVFLIKNYKKIKAIWFKIKEKMKHLDILFIWSFIYIISFIISKNLELDYIYLIVFLFIVLFSDTISKLSNYYFKIIVILFWIGTMFYNLDYFSYIIILFIFFIFSVLRLYFDNIYNEIDIKKINIFEIKQWDILTSKTIEIIKNDIGIEYLESPLQWNEIHYIIWEYKKLWTNPEVSIYNDIKIGIIMYIWYIITILYFIYK